MEAIHTSLTSEAHAYSQGYVHNGTIYTSGQVGINPVNGSLEDDIATQTARALSNLTDVLAVAGSSLNHVLSTTCMLASMDDFPEFNRVYAQVFAGHKPARVTISTRLAPGLLVEIDAVAAVD